MKIEDVRAKSEDELNAALLGLRKEQLNLRFQQTNSQLNDTAQLRKVRRDIARIKTVLSDMNTGRSPIAEKAKKAAPQKKTASKPAAKKPAAKKDDAKKDDKAA